MVALVELAFLWWQNAYSHLNFSTLDNSIPLDFIKQLDEKELHVLLIQGFNNQVQRIDQLGTQIQTFVAVLDGKISRAEFIDFEKVQRDTNEDHRKRLGMLENKNGDRELKKETVLGLGKTFWIGILVVTNVLQLLALLAKIGATQ